MVVLFPPSRVWVNRQASFAVQEHGFADANVLKNVSVKANRASACCFLAVRAMLHSLTAEYNVRKRLHFAGSKAAEKSRCLCIAVSIAAQMSMSWSVSL